MDSAAADISAIVRYSPRYVLFGDPKLVFELVLELVFELVLELGLELGLVYPLPPASINSAPPRPTTPA